MIDDEIAKQAHSSFFDSDHFKTKIPLLPPVLQKRRTEEWALVIKNDHSDGIMTRRSYEAKRYGKKFRAIFIVKKVGLHHTKKRNRSESQKCEIKSLVLLEQDGVCAGLFDKEGEHLPCSREIIFEENTEIDHIIELQYGGADLYINLQALCPDCHKKKTKGNRKLPTDASHQEFY